MGSLCACARDHRQENSSSFFLQCGEAGASYSEGHRNPTTFRRSYAFAVQKLRPVRLIAWIIVQDVAPAEETHLLNQRQHGGRVGGEIWDVICRTPYSTEQLLGNGDIEFSGCGVSAHLPPIALPVQTPTKKIKIPAGINIHWRCQSNKRPVLINPLKTANAKKRSNMSGYTPEPFLAMSS